MGVRARPVRHHLRPDQQFTTLQQRVVEPLPLGADILQAGLLAERLQDGLDGGGAFRGEVPADHAGALERGPDLHVPVVEPVIIGVGPGGAPFLLRHRGDDPQVIPGGARGRGLHQDLDGLRAQLRGELLRPFGDRHRPGLGDVLGGQGGSHLGVVAQQPHLPHLDPGVLAGHVGHCHQPRGGVAVPVAVMRVGGVEPGQHQRVGGGELRLHLSQRPQHRPARGGVQLIGARAVEVVQADVYHPQRIGDAHPGHLLPVLPLVNPSSAPFVWPAASIAQVF
jgi:hypothetical protein